MHKHGLETMGHPKTHYELSESQVKTPERVVSLFWKLVGRYRKDLGSVLDMGAGDCRFAKGGGYSRYTGVEIDGKRIGTPNSSANHYILHGCVFRHRESGYDASIGNPPYVRHHDIQSPWKDNTLSRLEQEMRVSLGRHSNLYLYFFCLGLLKTHREGLVALIIPYEWVSRPSARCLREYIQSKRWNVSVYRFQVPIFGGVLTTASISIVDKRTRSRRWTYYDITPDYRVKKRAGVTNSKKGVLDYQARGKIWGLRGLSTGTQKVFTLTEEERINAGLKMRDVVPCVNTLRRIPESLTMLTHAAFQKHFVRAGERCWLIRSYEERRSDALNAYLSSVPRRMRRTYTCVNQRPWFRYRPHPIPRILYGTCFTKFGPKVLINSVGACAIGTVGGIHGSVHIPARRLQSYLLGINLEKRVVEHANSLKKIEVRQLNSVLNNFVRREHNNGR